MALKPNQIRHLRTLAHALKPVILVGAKGVTDAVVAELDLALARHELVKVRLAGDDRQARGTGASDLAARTRSEVVQRVGKTVSLYRRNPEGPGIELPR
jgi:RNA-binding protein